MRRIAFALLVALMGCSACSEVPEDFHAVPEETDTFIKDFEAQLGRRIRSEVGFTRTLPKNIHGKCIIELGHRYVVMNENTWPVTINKAANRAKLYHEMGHCEIGRDHVALKYVEIGPKQMGTKTINSLMITEPMLQIGDFEWDCFKDYYFDELLRQPLKPMESYWSCPY
ncbi:MAG: hypothetical protein AB1405_02035 [Bdellovibrionota bacterium]